MRLARGTVAGAGELARRSARSAARLRENVTSPGGTTAAALDVLMAPDGLAALLDRAVAAAAQRSRELAWSRRPAAGTPSPRARGCARPRIASPTWCRSRSSWRAESGWAGFSFAELARRAQHVPGGRLRGSS